MSQRQVATADHFLILTFIFFFLVMTILSWTGGLVSAWQDSRDTRGKKKEQGKENKG